MFGVAVAVGAAVADGVLASDGAAPAPAGMETTSRTTGSRHMGRAKVERNVGLNKGPGAEPPSATLGRGNLRTLDPLG